MRLKVTIGQRYFEKQIKSFYLWLAVILMLSAAAFASQIGSIKSFAYNSLITSADINDNFSAIATAHNDTVGKVTNMIAFFAGDCPSGWVEYTAARGRVILATVAGGTNGNTNTDDDGAATAVALTAATPRREVAHVPAHSHTGQSGNTGAAGHGHTGIPADQALPGSGATVVRTNNSLTHNHSITTTTSTTTHNTTGGGGTATDTIDVAMPYVQLKACQFTSP